MVGVLALLCRVGFVVVGYEWPTYAVVWPRWERVKHASSLASTGGGEFFYCNQRLAAVLPALAQVVVGQRQRQHRLHDGAGA